MHAFAKTAARLELLRGGVVHGPASGFFYLSSGRMFLVTNWHVVTGVNAETIQALSSTGFIPEKLRLYWKRSEPGVGGQSLFSIHSDISLFDEHQMPLWFEHSSRNNVDVVALPIQLDNYPTFANLAVNQVNQDLRLPIEAGTDCFVVGFPEGLRGPGVTPIWKRGSIATEPTPHFPFFLIDSATRQGMSGAPVFIRHNGIFGTNANGMPDEDTMFGTIEKFVGIYSGRVGDDALGFQLGKVWHYETLEDIMTCRTPGHHPLI